MTEPAIDVTGTNSPPRGPHRRLGHAPRRAILAALGLLASVGLNGCSAPGDLERPDETRVRELLLAALGDERPAAGAPSPSLFAGFDIVDGERRFRVASVEELAALWLPEPLEDLAIEEMQCRYFPVWRISFRPVVAGQSGPRLIAEIVDLEAEAAGPGTAPTSGTRIVIRWWPMRRTSEGNLAPDFRPFGRARHEAADPSSERRTLAVFPPWVMGR